jgi:hypothetical protein
MGFTHTLSTLEALRMADDLARLTGGEEYLTTMIQKVQEELLAAERLPERIRRIESGDRRYLIPKKIVIPERVTRSLPKVRREELRRAHPVAYWAAVRSMPPDNPYQVRLESTRRTASTYWRMRKEQGRAEWERHLGQRFGSQAWNASVRAEALLAMREMRTAQEKRVTEEKRVIAEAARREFEISRERPLVIPGQGDNRLAIRENRPRYQVDYDLLEERYPAAAALIVRSKTAGFTWIDFAPWEPTAEEPDDSDDSAWGMDYRARRGIA